MSQRFHRAYRHPASGQPAKLKGDMPGSPLTRRRFLGSTGAALLLMISPTGQAAQPSVRAGRV